LRNGDVKGNIPDNFTVYKVVKIIDIHELLFAFGMKKLHDKNSTRLHKYLSNDYIYWIKQFLIQLI